MDYRTITARPAAQSSVNERMAFIKRVYAWMLGAVVICSVGAWASISMGFADKLARTGTFTWLAVIIGWGAVGWGAQKVRHTPTLNVLAFVGYSLYSGMVVSVIVWVAMMYGQALANNPGIYVYQALGITTAAFTGLSCYAFFTKRDFSWMRGMLTLALFGLIAMMLLNMFIVESTILSLGISFAVVLVFGGFVLYDTQKVLKEFPTNEHIAGAITLFTDFVMLFWHILRIILILASGGD